MVRATDAKEVGVGDPAEGNDLLLRPKSVLQRLAF
jgi:hypothetical protein